MQQSNAHSAAKGHRLRRVPRRVANARADVLEYVAATPKSQMRGRVLTPRPLKVSDTPPFHSCIARRPKESITKEQNAR